MGVFYAVALTIVVTTTLAGLMLAVYVIVILSSWLIEIDDKLDWVIGNTVIMTQQAICMWVMELSLASTIVLGAFHAKVLLGFFAIIPAVTAIFIQLVVRVPDIVKTFDLHLQATKELIGAVGGAQEEGQGRGDQPAETRAGPEVSMAEMQALQAQMTHMSQVLHAIQAQLLQQNGGGERHL